MDGSPLVCPVTQHTDAIVRVYAIVCTFVCTRCAHGSYIFQCVAVSVFSFCISSVYRLYIVEQTRSLCVHRICGPVCTVGNVALFRAYTVLHPQCVCAADECTSNVHRMYIGSKCIAAFAVQTTAVCRPSVRRAPHPVGEGIFVASSERSTALCLPPLCSPLCALFERERGDMLNSGGLVGVAFCCRQFAQLISPYG